MTATRDSEQPFHSPSTDKFQKSTNSAADEGAGVVLALGGGFSRGFAHLGVLKVLEQERIPVATIVGTSIGGLLGAAYADGIPLQVLSDLGRQVRVRDFLRFHQSGHAEDEALWQIPAQRKDCIGQFVQDWFRTCRLEDLPIPTAIVATNLATGAPYVFVRGPIETAIRATCAFPGLVKPVVYDGHQLADGCMAAPVPSEIAARIGGGRVLAVSVGSSSASAGSAENVVRVFDRDFGSSQRSALEPSWARHADILLEPQVHRIAWNDFSRVDEAFDSGAEAMRRALPFLRELLARPSRFSPATGESLRAERDLAL